MRKSAAVLGAMNLLLALYVTIALARVVRNTASPAGGADFYPYWYASLFLRQGSDPYAAFLGGRSPSAAEPRQQQLAAAPAVTMPLLLPVVPVSFLPWSAAKWVWLAVSVATIALAPRFALAAAERYGIAVGDPLRLTAYLLFYSLLATRVAAGNGQLVCPVILLLMMSVAAEVSAPWLAGVALGLALSKYSVAVAVVVFFLLRRAWRSLAAAAVVQAVGIGALSLWSGSSPAAVVREIAAIARMHSGASGYQFPSPAADVLLALALLAFAWWRWPRRQFEVLALLCAGSLLVVYHRVYDAVLLLPAIVVLLPAMASSAAVRVVAGLAFVVLMLPGTIIGSPWWIDASASAQRYAVLALLLVLAAELTRAPAPAAA